MLKTLLSLVVVSLLATASSFAGAVTASAAITSGLSYKGDPVLANSNPAISGNPNLKTAVQNGDDTLTGSGIVLIGSFNLTDAQIQANSTNLSFLTNPQNFVQFGSMLLGDNHANQPGYFENTVTGDATALGIANKQIYMFVIAATNVTSVANAISTAYQIGVFYQSMSAQNSGWKFPAQNAVPNTTSIELSDLTVNTDGAVLSPFANVVIGSFGPDKSNSDPTSTNFILSSVPEPSSCVFLGLGAAGMLFRRRRVA